jgi:hypothetical protein
MSPVIFQTAEDYYVPLLRLLATLEGGQGRAGDIVRLFGEMYRENIPDWHYEHTKDGETRWQTYVHWSRYSLVKQGFMDSPAHGIWRITEAGRRWLEEHPDATRLEPTKRGAPARRERPRPSVPLGVTLEQLRATRALMPPDQFRAIWGALYDRLLAEERARAQTDISDTELARRARRVLREIHAFLKGESGSISSEKAYNWMIFCYTLSLHRETAALFTFVAQDDLPEWAYERARRMAEACRAQLE